MNEVSRDRTLRRKPGRTTAGANEPALVAVDLGAESCRVSLLRWIDGPAEIQLVHRFANSARIEGKWIFAGILSHP